jgi:hypothetical protein
VNFSHIPKFRILRYCTAWLVAVTREPNAASLSNLPDPTAGAELGRPPRARRRVPPLPVSRAATWDQLPPRSPSSSARAAHNDDEPPPRVPPRCPVPSKPQAPLPRCTFVTAICIGRLPCLRQPSRASRQRPTTPSHRVKRCVGTPAAGCHRASSPHRAPLTEAVVPAASVALLRPEHLFRLEPPPRHPLRPRRPEYCR